MRKLILLFVVCLLALTSYAQQVELVKVQASKMTKEVENNVIKPADYSDAVDYPVLYLLHGYGGNHNDWVNIVPQIKDLATACQMIVVCPNGANSWYFDSPINKDIQYETYIIKDLIPYIDQHYSTIAHRNGRAISGLSMGGHGALYLAIRHKDMFAMAGAMSGGVDITKTSQAFELAKVLGPMEENEELWKSSSVLGQADNLRNGELDICFDCGTEDMFAESNAELHAKLTANGVAHDYTTRPGNHNWDYWTNSIYYHMLYFHLGFNRLASTEVPGGSVYFYDAPGDGTYDPSWTTATAPSVLPELTGKLIVDSDVKYSGKNSLRLRWTSNEGGSWAASIAAKNWANVDMSKSSEIRFWVCAKEEIENKALPLIYLQNSQYALSGKVKMGKYVDGNLPASTWVEIVVPLADLLVDAPSYNLSSNKTIFFSQDIADGKEHTLNIDYVTVMDDPNYQPPTEMVLFADSKDNTYYDPSWVNLTAPSTVDVPEGHAEKLPVVTDIKQEGENALRLTYTSMEGGVWKALVAGLGWNLFDLTEADYELRFWVRATETLSGDVLPVMYFEGNGGGTTGKLKLSDYVSALNADEWTEVVVPIEDFRKADPAFSKWDIVKGLFFSQNAADGKAHTLYLDNMKFQIVGGSSVEEVGLAENGMNLFYSNGSICYDGIEGNVAVYNLAGVKCVEFAASQKGEFKCSLENGVYVAVVENASRKFIVK